MTVTKERLLSRRQIDPTGCWIWTGFYDSHGYGVLTLTVGDVPGRMLRLKVHRLAADLWSVRGEGQDVCHSCDQPSCFNPEHLFRGTRLDNMRDASAKGRMAHYALRRLSITDAEEVRRTYKPRDRYSGMRAMARRFGVSKVAILQILRGQTYKQETLSCS